MSFDFDDLEFEFAEKFHKVHIETDAFTADAYEMYEMPSASVIAMMNLDGPDQMLAMREMLKLALIEPAASKELDDLSFNDFTTAMFQWYQKSSERLEKNKKRQIASSQKDKPMLIETELTMEDLRRILLGSSENDSDSDSESLDVDVDVDVPKKKKPHTFGKADNDPGDNISPFGA
jgi:hypothetical protein